MRAFVVALFALLMIALSSTAAQAGVIYAATAAGAAGELYTLDSATGAVIADIGPLNDASAVNYPITGLAFHPTTGVLYGSTGNAASVDAMLVTINPATGQVTPVGSFNTGVTNSSGTPATMADISFDPAGNLFGVASIGGPQLYSINPATGQATVIGSTGITSTSGGALAFTDAGTAYGSPTGTRFGTYNTVTGAFTNIANPVEPTGGGAWGAFTYGEGKLFGLNVGAGSPPPTAIVVFNPATGANTLVGNTLSSIDAIAYLPEPGTATVIAMGAVVALSRRARHWRVG
jgi:hypothetical protein